MLSVVGGLVGPAADRGRPPVRALAGAGVRAPRARRPRRPARSRRRPSSGC
ncbi:MAG: hypothetical protein MZV64_27950 [Ignavibacteriales bacterium]|nr:hypothetical protein [Ignavibacteriales bacterium]